MNLSLLGTSAFIVMLGIGVLLLVPDVYHFYAVHYSQGDAVWHRNATQAFGIATIAAAPAYYFIASRLPARNK